MAKILVVDDSTVIRSIIGDMLRDAGHEVVEAKDGVQGLERYRREHPHGVLMDITMPGLDGMSALFAIRQIDPTAQITMLTARSQMQTAMAAIHLGARDFVVKPFDRKRVLLAVERMLEAREAGEAPPVEG